MNQTVSAAPASIADIVDHGDATAADKMLGDVETGGVASSNDVENGGGPGVWKWLRPKSGYVSDLELSSTRGLYSVEHVDLRIAPDALVGVHRDGKTLRFVGYESAAPTSWWSSVVQCFSFSSRVGHGKVAKDRVLHRKEIVLEAESEDLAARWHAAGMDFLGRASPRDQLPLLVFINPYSGAGFARNMWEHEGVNIICKDAGHAVDVVVTNRANHALEMTRDHADLCAAYKGIVIVSGDGLIYEVLQGMMQRPDWARCMQTITIGVLPGGSGNGLAKSLSDEAHLAHGVAASAFLVAKGKSEMLDVAAVDIYSHSDGEDAPQPRRVYSFLSLEWAMIADIDIGSEYMRALGALRFQLEGLKRAIFTRKYRGRISYLPCIQERPLPRTPKDVADMASLEMPMYWEEHGDLIADIGAEAPHLDLVPPPGAPVPSDWETVEGNFWSMWNCNVPWMSGTEVPAKESQVSDGLIQLNYLRDESPGGMNRLRFARFLLGLDAGDHPAYCEMTPTRAYRLEPLPEANGAYKKGYIAIDGENVEYTALQMQNMRGFMRVYSNAV